MSEFQFSPINGMCHENSHSHENVNSIKFICNFAHTASDLEYLSRPASPQAPQQVPSMNFKIKLTFIFMADKQQAVANKSS